MQLLKNVCRVVSILNRLSEKVEVNEGGYLLNKYLMIYMIYGKNLNIMIKSPCVSGEDTCRRYTNVHMLLKCQHFT